MCGGRFYFTVFRSLSTNPKVKELLKSVHICQSYCKNKSGTFFNGPRCIFVLFVDRLLFLPTVAVFGDSQSPFSVTVAEFSDSRRVLRQSPFWRQSPFSATVALFGDCRQKRRLSPNSATVTENVSPNSATICRQCGQGFRHQGSLRVC